MAKGLSRKKYSSGTGVTNGDANYSFIGNSQALQSSQLLNNTLSGVTLADGTKIESIAPALSYIPDNSGNTGYAQAPQASGGGSSGGSEGSSITSSVFDDVSKVYQNMNQNTMTNQAVANDIFNRNVTRKNEALNESTAASNLRGAAQNQMQAGIQFGQQQQDRAGQQAVAAAWAKGVSSGLVGNSQPKAA